MLYIDGSTNNQRQLFVLKENGSGGYTVQQVVPRGLDSYSNNYGRLVTNTFSGVDYQWQIDKENDSFYMLYTNSILHYKIAANGNLTFKNKYSYDSGRRSQFAYYFTFNEDLFYSCYNVYWDSSDSYQRIIAYQKQANGDLVSQKVYNQTSANDRDEYRNRLLLASYGKFLYTSNYDESHSYQAIYLYYPSGGDGSLSHVKDEPLRYTRDMKFSPDEKQLYVCGNYYSSSGWFKVYDIDSSGLLTLKHTFNNSNGRLNGANKITVSKDGNNVYVQGKDRIAVFQIKRVVE